MLGWLWRMLVGRFTTPPKCPHKWQIIAQGPLDFEEGGLLKTHKGTCTLYTLRCDVCGEITTRTSKM